MNPTVKHTPQADCSQILSQLNDYANGELPADLCGELEEHLAQCENCSIVLDTLRKTIYLVRDLRRGPPEIPHDVETRLFAVLDLEEYLPENRT